MIVGILLAVILPFAWAIPIDNGVEGEPEIECGATGMTINFNIRNAFEGHVYVKGRFAEAGCRSDEGGRKVAGMTLGFDACGTERSRSLSPRGVFVRQTVVISFHPQFVTKVDRAYTIQCFYMEADKTVSQEIEVSDITTAFQSQVVPMPVCRYDILEGGPTGQPVKFALIGQMVFHKWTCDTETTDIFCMVVHSCTVDDGAGNKANLLDDNGCGLDRHLLQNLEYTTDLMAGRESHVFKYADKAALFFSCQISITIKEPGSQCAKPQCGEPGGAGNGGLGVTGGTRRPGPIGTAPPAKVTIPRLGTQAPKVTPPPAQPTAAKTSATPAAASQNPAAASPAPTAAGPTPAAASPTPAAGSPSPAPPSPTPPGLVSLPPVTATVATVVPVPLVLNDTVINNVASRQRRNSIRHDELGVWDVRAQPITAMDLDEFQPSQESHKLLKQIQSYSDPKPVSMDYCLSPMSFSLIIATTVVSGLIAGIATVVLCLRHPSTKF